MWKKNHVSISWLSVHWTQYKKKWMQWCLAGKWFIDFQLIFGRVQFTACKHIYIQNEKMFYVYLRELFYEHIHISVILFYFFFVIVVMLIFQPEPNILNHILLQHLYGNLVQLIINMKYWIRLATMLSKL